MKVTTSSEAMQLKEQSEPDRFTGRAAFRVLHTSDQPAATAEANQDPNRGDGTWNTFASNVSMVRYDAGARTHWHSHSGGQMLYIVEGEGWVQTRGEPPRRVRPGDAISFAPGEAHWHGANTAGPMAHVTITAGKPTWFEESEAPAG